MLRTKGARAVDSFFVKPTANNNVTAMETRFAYFFAEHNNPFAVADHLSKLMRGIMAEAVTCPEVATKFGCGRTKTTRIIKSAIAPSTFREKQSDYFGKKGMSVHVDVIFQRNEIGKLKKLVYFTSQYYVLHIRCC